MKNAKEVLAQQRNKYHVYDDSVGIEWRLLIDLISTGVNNDAILNQKQETFLSQTTGALAEDMASDRRVHSQYFHCVAGIAAWINSCH